MVYSCTKRLSWSRRAVARCRYAIRTPGTGTQQPRTRPAREVPHKKRLPADKARDTDWWCRAPLAGPSPFPRLLGVPSPHGPETAVTGVRTRAGAALREKKGRIRAPGGPG